MTENLMQLKKKNAPDTFSVWMRKYSTAKTTLPTSDDAAATRVRAGVGHGANAEALYGMGLQNGGYAQYLKTQTERDFASAKTAYKTASDAVKEQNLSGYARYLSDHEQKQSNLKRRVTESIASGDSLDLENAYRVALASGLTEKNARIAAEIGIEAAKKQISGRLIQMILDKRLATYRVSKYAKEMGFSDEEAERFAAYAKDINSVKTPSKIPDDLFE